MNLNRWKCEILYLGTSAHMMCSIMCYGQLESSLTEKDLEGNLVDKKLTTYQQYACVAKKVSNILGYVRMNATSRLREVIFLFA